MEQCTSNWTDVLTAIGTISAVAAAVFVSFIPKLFRPILEIGVRDAFGVRQQVLLEIPNSAYSRDAWAQYFHIEVRNQRRWVKAHNVAVFLLRMEEWTSGKWVQVWAGGGLRLAWGHEYATGSLRDVGPPASADLLHVVQDVDPAHSKWLQLTPTVQPYKLELRRRDPCRLRLTLRARSDESDSGLLVVLVDWNGQWADEPDAMAQHISVAAIKDA